MSRLAPYTHLILAALQEVHRRHAIAGWYDVRYLLKWLHSKHRAELDALYDAFRDERDPKLAAQKTIEAYLPSLNQKKMGTIPVEPKGTVVMWKVSPNTAPPAEAPPPVAEALRKERPRRVRGQPWISLINQGDLEGLRRWLDAGGDPNAPGRAEGESPLDYAAGMGAEAMVRLLLERGARGVLPLREAVLNDRGAIARLLLESATLSAEDLREARAIVRDLMDDPELARLIEKARRRQRP
jgi:hypothetical protein